MHQAAGVQIALPWIGDSACTFVTGTLRIRHGDGPVSSELNACRTPGSQHSTRQFGETQDVLAIFGFVMAAYPGASTLEHILTQDSVAKSFLSMVGFAPICLVSNNMMIRTPTRQPPAEPRSGKFAIGFLATLL